MTVLPRAVELGKIRRIKLAQFEIGFFWHAFSEKVKQQFYVLLHCTQNKFEPSSYFLPLEKASCSECNEKLLVCLFPQLQMSVYVLL